MTVSLLRARSTLVWLLLVVVTLLSWALGADHGVGSTVAVVVLGLAVVKVRFVGLDFMELRTAPLILRALLRRTASCCGWFSPVCTCCSERRWLVKGNVPRAKHAPIDPDGRPRAVRRAGDGATTRRIASHARGFAHLNLRRRHG